jgi:hypothetical protein
MAWPTTSSVPLSDKVSLINCKREKQQQATLGTRRLPIFEFAWGISEVGLEGTAERRVRSVAAPICHFCYIQSAATKQVGGQG